MVRRSKTLNSEQRLAVVANLHHKLQQYREHLESIRQAVLVLTNMVEETAAQVEVLLKRSQAAVKANVTRREAAAADQVVAPELPPATAAADQLVAPEEQRNPGQGSL